jgi:hypothetical protein
MLDLRADLSGNVTEALTEYTWEANRQLIGESFHKTSFLLRFPFRRSIDRYPDTTTCEHEVGTR